MMPNSAITHLDTIIVVVSYGGSRQLIGQRSVNHRVAIEHDHAEDIVHAPCMVQ